MFSSLLIVSFAFHILCDRCYHGAPCIPSFLDAIVYHVARYSVGLSPSGGVFDNTIYFDIQVLSIVAVLFFLCDPSAIIGRIGAIVIDSVNGISFSWPLSHIGEEISKSILPLPAITNKYPATTVIKVIRMVRIVAAFKHSAICSVFNGPAHSMLFFGFAKPLYKKASTGFDSAICQFVTTDFFSISAFAFAPKITIAINHFGKLKHGESMKFLTNKVFSFCAHNNAPFINILYRIMIYMQGLYSRTMDN